MVVMDLIFLALMAVEPTALPGGSLAWQLQPFDMVVIAAAPEARLTLVPRPLTDPWPGIADPGVVVCNAGYVDGDQQPTGWRLINGQQTHVISPDPVQSGIAWLDGEGRLAFAWATAPLPQGAVFGLQAGPFLIDPGGEPGIRRRDGPIARRSAIAVSSTGQRLLIMTRESCTLHAFANVIRDLPQRIGVAAIHAALNLDGGPATGIYCLSQPQLNCPPRGPVAEVWVLRER